MENDTTPAINALKSGNTNWLTDHPIQVAQILNHTSMHLKTHQLDH